MTTKMTRERIQQWLDGPYDQDTKQEIYKQLERNPAELQDAFFKDLSFGTGGLRAKMGIGTNRLNQYTIGMATQGLANYLGLLFSSESSVFIGYDVRHHSREFALQAARVLAANQIRVFLAKEICPTPLVSFACRHFHCKAGIMITASHNPPEYNGYKVYWSDGGQIVAPHDQGIIEEVRKICNISQVRLAEPNSPLIEFIDASLDDAYLEKLSTYKLYPNLVPIHVIYTPLHGTGIRMIPKTLANWNFSCSLVEKQSSPDGLFTHAESPNPEEASALKLGAEMLVEKQADLLLGTDPDADRVGAAVLHEGKPVFLTGHQIGCLCLDHICQALTERQKLPLNSLCVKTIVTTELFKKIAQHYGVSCIDVLTGFKYIAAEIAKRENTPYHYLFGAEESYGYLFNSFVR
ncbi:MAG: phospho-sugar mutase, partial [Chlamydiales bacterium]|nr:phospho-sugar mutase [Chlamydiales bacterium]